MKTILSLFLTLMVISITAQKKDRTLIRKIKAVEKEDKYAYIPAGAFQVGMDIQLQPQLNYQPISRKFETWTVESFFMAKCEVSNGEYLEFLEDIKSRDEQFYRDMLPDTLVWRSRLGYIEPFVEYYLRHPAYRNYPVVGITFEQAQTYADWLTETYYSEEQPLKKVHFRLPTEEEWEYAAQGGSEQNIFPWNDRSTKDKKGNLLANFKYMSQISIFSDSMVVPRALKVPATRNIEIIRCADYINYSYNYNIINDSEFTAPVKSYKPNGFGLYNMAGNVSEMVMAYYSRTLEEYHSKEKSNTPWGITRGGSWDDTGYYIQTCVRQHFSQKEHRSSKMGFRLVMEVEEY